MSNPAREALDRLHLARTRLIRDYPFHVAVLSHLPLYPDHSVRSIAVTYAADELRILFNPEYIMGCALTHQESLLLHEVLHMAFRHLTARAEDFEDPRARIISEEVTVNEWIKLPLPPTPITLKDFPELPPNESTQQRYERLRKILTKRPCAAKTLDDHSLWAKIQDPDQAHRAIRNTVLLAIARTGVEAIPKEMREPLGMLFGLAPGADLTTVFGTGRAQVHWRQLLRRYVGKILEREPSYQRPDRRLPELLGIVPGKSSLSSKPKVLAVIDTSASISDEHLEDFDAELHRLGRDYEVTVVEVDAAIQAVYRYRPITRPKAGRGGTDFRPVFEPEFLRRQLPDVLLYLTDGFGSPPEQRPRVPTIWVLTPNGQRPVPWGHEARLA
jgi:predicted metal-dependent peptidase